MRSKRRPSRRAAHRRKSEQNPDQDRDSKAHASSRRRFNRDLELMPEPAAWPYFKISLQKMRVFHGSSANTRTAPPEPPSNLIGATTRDAPDSGSSFIPARIST